VALVEVVLAAEHQVDVLVGLGLVGLVGGLGQRPAVGGVVAVVGDAVGRVGVGQGQAAPGGGNLVRARGEHVVLHAEPRVGVRHAEDVEAAVRVGRAGRQHARHAGGRPQETELGDGGVLHRRPSSL
jgi:hypothetical protein